MIRAAQARAARKRYREMAPVLNEQSRRRFVALEARALGHGGVSLMARISGLARRRFITGFPTFAITWRRRLAVFARPGGGRKKKASQDPTLLVDLKTPGRAGDAGRSDAAAVVDDPQLA